MLDPITFAAAIAMAVAAALAGPPAPTVAPAWVAPEKVAEHIAWVDAPRVNTPDVVHFDEQGFSLGWIVSSVTGNVVCVTAAPCEQDANFRGVADSSWNWETETEQ